LNGSLGTFKTPCSRLSTKPLNFRRKAESP
jgi:hypothetical protein